MTLDDVDVTNGAMHLLPESHLTSVGHERSEQTTALLDYGDQVDAAQAAVIDLPAGGALFHHCQTLHYTPPNQTDRQRRAFVIHFMPPGTRSAHTGQLPHAADARLIRQSESGQIALGACYDLSQQGIDIGVYGKKSARRRADDTSCQ
ncbi:MAG: phytanoyl-CoA dioxygenase family protein [Candidatus Latescibacteria bacterium]|nr:phytanoyl-CoA dioxygenase family protein [Candidatus Latescibacterota bacterium]